MKVLIPFPYYYPETCSGIFVVDDVIHKLAAEGHEAVIYVPTPTRNVREGAKWKRDERLCDGKIRIHRFHMFRECKSPILRAFRYLLCEFFYLHHMLWDKYDVAFIDSTPPIQGLKLSVVNWFRNKPFVYNAQDLFPETLCGTGLAKKGGWLWKIGLWVSKVTFRNSDKIIAISQDIRNNIIAKGFPSDKVEVVYNWVNEKAIVPVDDSENPLFDEFNISQDAFRVVYAGNLGNAQNIDIIIDAASRMKSNQGIEFIIFGRGGMENQIRARIESEDLKNIKLLPLQPFEKVSFVYSMGNVCIVACKPGLGGASMPSKTCSIMSSGRSVLANFDKGELKTVIEENNCGVFTNAGDLNGLVAAIEELSKNPSRCQEMGKNGRKFVINNLTKEVGSSKYVEIIKSVLK